MALLWGMCSIPSADSADALRDLESRLLRFEMFTPDTEAQELEGGADISACDTHAQRALLLLEMPLVETALRSGASTAFDQRTRSLETRTRSILSCSPRESFVWLVAFDLEILHGQLDEHAFKLLAMSYDTSPNEAWISVRRAIVAVPLMLLVPTALRQKILKEFELLIRNGFSDAAARAYSKSSQSVRTLLQADVEKLDATARRAFSDALERLNS